MVGKIFNSAAICYDNKIQDFYDKILLPNYDVFDEKRFFTSGLESKNSINSSKWSK